MEIKPKTKGSWAVRFFILLLGIVLGILFYSLLNFVVADIGTIPSPEYDLVRREFIPERLDQKRDALNKEIQVVKKEIQTQTEMRQILKDSTDSLQNTISQLLTLQKESLEKNVEFAEQSRRTLQESQSVFLDNQKKYQEANLQISQSKQKQWELDSELAKVNEEIQKKEKDVQYQWGKLLQRHRLKIAAFKLTFLVPVFLILSFLFQKYRTSAWRPIVWATFLAVFVKIAFVAHEYFPSRFFKYIAILVLLAIVLRILVYLIKMVVSPKKHLLIRQYQENYDKYLCPVCSKPIRSGPLRYLGGLKKKQILLPLWKAENCLQEPYTCPSCGTNLYGQCEKCGGIRHMLLPHCEHCGADRGIQPPNGPGQKSENDRAQQK